MVWRSVLAAAALAAAGCAVRAPRTYRLAPQANSQVLVPPLVADAGVSRGAFAIDVSRGGACTPPGDAIAVVRHGRKLHISVARDALLRQAPGWLRQWAGQLEARGCIPNGSGLELAERVEESIPLDPAAAWRLLHADNMREGYVELGPENRLQVQAPIVKSGTSPDAELLEVASVTGSDRALNVDLRLSEDVIGVETSWYTLQPKPAGNGTTIVALSAERNIGGTSQPEARPARDYFRFGPRIGFYRLIYKADLREQGVTNEIVVGAPGRMELEERTRRVLSDAGACQSPDPETCMPIPRHVALNPALAVTVNGREVRVGVRAMVRSAIVQGGGPRRAEDVLPSLAVKKPYAGQLVDVEFDRSSGAILNLTLLGGESISWQ